MIQIVKAHRGLIFRFGKPSILTISFRKMYGLRMVVFWKGEIRFESIFYFRGYDAS